MLAPDSVLQKRYRIVRKLSEGGMGIVYEAVDARLDAIVALKECNFTDEKLRKQFEREARLLARLRHPSMPRVIDHFDEGDGQFLVMDFVVGDDLLEMLNRRKSPFPPDEVLSWADQLLDALDYLHRQDPPVVHRDIKPQNLKLTLAQKVMLLDFGLAKGSAGLVSPGNTFGSVFGFTPNYAPLEQIKGTGTDPRSDLYSLAATLYHLMTGIVPPDVLTRVAATTDELPDPLLPANEVNPQVSPGVAVVLTRSMTIGRSQRVPSAAEMRNLLHQANQSVFLETMSGPTLIAAKVAPTIASPPQVLDTTELNVTAGATGGTDSSEGKTLRANTPSTRQPIVTVGPKDPQLETTPVMPLQTQVVANRKPFRLLWLAIPASVILMIVFGVFLALRPRTNIAALNEQALPSPSQTQTVSSVQENTSSPQSITAVDAPTSTPKPTATKSTPTQTPTPSSEPPKTEGATRVGPTNIDAPPSPRTPLAGGVLNGRAISLPRPPYPAIARASHAQGRVNVQVLIDESGNVVSAQAISGHPLLQAVSVAAARHAKFTPTLLSGQPVKVSGLIVYNFVADEPKSSPSP
jgi:TonB family protein